MLYAVPYRPSHKKIKTLLQWRDTYKHNVLKQQLLDIEVMTVMM